MANKRWADRAACALLSACTLLTALTGCTTARPSTSVAPTRPPLAASVPPARPPLAASASHRAGTADGQARAATLRAVAPGCRSRLSRSEEKAPQLTRSSDGALVFASPAPPSPVLANAGDPATRWVGDALPAPPDGRPTVIFYTPHPDDETLSAGVVLAEAAAKGDRVIIVALTDGADTRAILAVNRRLDMQFRAAHANSDSGFVPLTPSDIGAARLRELRASAGALGVSPTDVYAAHLDALGSDCAGMVSVHEADQVMRAFAARFPDATHITMSYDAERQQDHLAAGVALRALRLAGLVTHARWVVSRLWWALPSPRWRWVQASGAGDHQPMRIATALRAAAGAYEQWNPARGQYDVGGTSVHGQFAALLLDERDREHGLGPDVAGASLSVRADALHS